MNTKYSIAFCLSIFVNIILLLSVAILLSPDPQQPKHYDNNTDTALMIRGDRWGLSFGKQDEMLDMMHLFGITNCKTRQLYIRGSLPLAVQRDTVLHELLHAGTCDTEGEPHNLYYNSQSESGHEGIYKISDYVTTLLHDNPELARYLIGQ